MPVSASRKGAKLRELRGEVISEPGRSVWKNGWRPKRGVAVFPPGMIDFGLARFCSCKGNHVVLLFCRGVAVFMLLLAY